MISHPSRQQPRLIHHRGGGSSCVNVLGIFLIVAIAVTAVVAAAAGGDSDYYNNIGGGEGEIPYEAPPFDEPPIEPPPPPPPETETEIPPQSRRGPLKVGDALSARIDQTEFSEVQPILTEDGSTATFTITFREGAPYTTVHFAQFDMGQSDCKMIVSGKDLANGRKQQYEMQGLGKMQLGTFWTQHVSGDTMFLRIECPSGLMTTDETHFEIDQVAVGFLQPANNDESLCGTSEQVNAICYSGHFSYTNSRCVARMLIDGVGHCTSFLISNTNYLLTNHHCVSSQSEANNMDYDFGAEAPACSTSNCANCYTGTVYSGSIFIKSSASLDYALLKLTGDPASTFGYCELELRSPEYLEQIYIVGHPQRRAKEISWYSTESADTDGVCRIQSTLRSNGCTSNGNAIGYYCDTEGGNSGSPVFSATSGKVLGLHNCGGCQNSGHNILAIWNEISCCFDGTCSCDSPAPTPTSPTFPTPTSPTFPTAPSSCGFTTTTTNTASASDSIWNVFVSYFFGG